MALGHCAHGIEDADRLGNAMRSIPGVVEHGLFLGMAHEAFIAGAGGVERLGATATW